jgi:Tfp pilus assembly major pilin PilA
MKSKAFKLIGFVVLLAAAMAAYIGFKAYQERQQKTAVIDSFESGTVYRIKIHNASTNYEATCNTNRDRVCTRFSAGERHPFGTLGGTVVFFDSPEAQAYEETKESTR